MIAFSMFGALILLMMLGLPVAISLGVVSTAWIIVAGRSLQMVASRMYDGMDQFVLMSIPFFCLAGEIMNHSGITDRLIQFVDYIVGRVRGGLAQANIYTSILFAGITGAAVADVSALGTIFIPAMVKQGYSRKFSVAVTAASSIVGPIIPPSIIIVIYGAVTGVSIGAIFAAAIVPGVVLGLSMSTYVALVARRRSFPKVEQPFDLKGFISTFKDAVLALIMPIIIVGGILGGIFTPTEAAAVSVFYAFIVGGFIYRSVKLKTIYISVVNAMKISGMLFFIIGFANILGWILARLNLPQTIAQLLLNLSDDPRITFLVVIALLIFIGTWLETGTACIILAPILSPAMKSVGIDPIHFATVMIVALNVGLITPPLGVALFAAVIVGGVSFEDACKEIWPFIVLDIVVLVLLIYVPTFSLAVPRLLGFI